MDNLVLQQGLQIFYPLNTFFFFQSLVLVFFAVIVFKNFLKKSELDESLFIFISFICLISILGFSSISSKFLHDGTFFTTKRILFTFLTLLMFYCYFEFKKKKAKEKK